MPPLALRILFALLLLLGVTTGAPASPVEGCRVLVVMSYEENHPWDRELREGIEAGLGACELRYAYLDSRTSPNAAPQKAREALETFRQWGPGGVIACDDEAQELLVVPHLRQLDTPVIFCGVTAEPEKYGYPTPNVSGILEKPYVSESISLLRQVAPQVQSLAFLLRASPSAKALEEQVKKESSSYPATLVHFGTAADITEATRLAIRYSVEADALLIDDLEGLPDEKGNPMPEKAVTQLLARIFSKPTLGIKTHNLGNGLLGGVVIRGQEQGRMAAALLREAMEGKEAGQIPLVRYASGIRLLNINALKALGLTPEPVMLRGIDFLRSRN